MKEKILEALKQLDPLNDDHWTSDGAPRMDAVESIVGDKSITRKDIIDAAPGFNRDKAGQPEEDETGEVLEGFTDVENTAEGSQTSGDQAGDQFDDHKDDSETDEGQAGDEKENHPSIEMTEEEFSKWLASVSPGELRDVEESLQDQMLNTSRQIEHLKGLLVRLRRCITTTRIRIDQVSPRGSEQDAIRKFIAAQNASRAAKVARRTEILRSVRPEELDPRAPIDAAMARKNKRGSKRPERPLLK